MSTAWIDDLAAELSTALAGSRRHEVADGVLWVTDPALTVAGAGLGDIDATTDDTGWTGDDDRRWARLTAAADVLGRAARRSPLGPGRTPGTS